jgi:hypothetical protein
MMDETRVVSSVTESTADVDTGRRWVATLREQPEAVRRPKRSPDAGHPFSRCPLAH